jgi:hypothetical protein
MPQKLQRCALAISCVGAKRRACRDMGGGRVRQSARPSCDRLAYTFGLRHAVNAERTGLTRRRYPRALDE